MDKDNISIESLQEAIINKQKLDKQEITIEDLDLEQIEYVNFLYKAEIFGIKKQIKELDEDNDRIRKKLGIDKI